MSFRLSWPFRTPVDLIYCLCFFGLVLFNCYRLLYFEHRILSLKIIWTNSVLKITWDYVVVHWFLCRGWTITAGENKWLLLKVLCCSIKIGEIIAYPDGTKFSVLFLFLPYFLGFKVVSSYNQLFTDWEKRPTKSIYYSLLITTWSPPKQKPSYKGKKALVLHLVGKGSLAWIANLDVFLFQTWLQFSNMLLNKLLQNTMLKKIKKIQTNN